MSKSLPKNYVKFPLLAPSLSPLEKVVNRLLGMLKSPIYWLAAYRYNVPGLQVHKLSMGLGLRLLLNPRTPILKGWSYQLMFAPMDSTRYFEFDFFWQTIQALSSKIRWLDVSSPRLPLLLALDKHSNWQGEFINPDSKDLAVTEMLLKATGLDKQCNLSGELIADVDYTPESFDLITSISVVEHIPADREAIEIMWKLLKPGGKLLLSMPCAANAYEQYNDQNEYALLKSDEKGYVFFQRFYDQSLLEENIFCVTGQPQRMQIFGEKEKGLFQRNAALKRATWHSTYPFWREPIMMGQEYRYFERIDELPGEGVVAMEFVKP